MQNLSMPATSWRKFSVYPSAGGLITIALLTLACVAPIAVQRYLSISPEVIGAVGIPAIIVFGFLGSVTVILPFPILSTVFVAATIINPVILVIAAAASITAGMAVCYILGKRGHSRAIRATEASQERLPRRVTNLYSWSTENVGTASFIITAIPNPVFDYVGFIAGAGKMDVQRFLAGTFMGKTIQASVVAFLGHTLGERLNAFL